MTANDYQQAKKLFNELTQLSERERASRLSKLEESSPELASEVRSLLDYHTAQSLIIPQTPKIRTKSTLSTSFHTRSAKWLSSPIRGLFVTLPILAITLGIAYWVSGLVHSQLRDIVDGRLRETVELRVLEFDRWESRQLTRAAHWARDESIQHTILDLLETTSELSPAQVNETLLEKSCAIHLDAKLNELAGRPVKFAVWDRRMLTIADWNEAKRPEILGAYVTTAGAQVLSEVFKGNSVMLLPRLGVAVTEGYTLQDGGQILSIFVPIRAPNTQQVVAVMMVRSYGMEDEYLAMLGSWSDHPSGEAYLVSQAGVMLSKSRYDTDSLNLAFKSKTAPRSFWVRDPGVNILLNQVPTEIPLAWRDTLLAMQVKSTKDGCYVDGYRNYVGQEVVGAWQWIERHKLAVAFEEEYASAFAISTLIQRALYGLSLTFALALFGYIVTTSYLANASRRFRNISEIGPYQIQELLGEGGMGQVFLAEHELLCRQSAIKVLVKGDNDLSIISRFEREVQLASQLTHPNTIAIYDFGRNKDGIFYYAMEYINGAHLGQLIEYAGPLAPGRCIFILNQLCRALQEAHHAGVVHRDIKPQNIMVCNRGGEPDFVKLFDYGLVKAFAPGITDSPPSQTQVVVGTPRFMAPERLNSPWLADPRVDVYSVGALAYFLLTGQLPTLVTPADTIDNEQLGVETLDLPPDVVEFGGLLSLCMAVEPSVRPSSMNSLLMELDELAAKFPWTRSDSENWWNEHESSLLSLVIAKRKKIKKQPNE